MADTNSMSGTILEGFWLALFVCGTAFAIWHVDLYRVKDKSEVRELGLDEARDEGVLLIEWPERMAELLPRDRLDIMIETTDDAARRVAKIVARGSWVARADRLT